MCGLDYYEELVSLIKKYGVWKDDIVYNADGTFGGAYIIEKKNVGKYTKVSIGFYDTYCTGSVRYETGAFKWDDFGLDWDKYSTATQKYNWDFHSIDLNFDGKNSTYEISGQLYASDYSPRMGALAYSNSNYDSSSKAGDAAEDSKEMLDSVLDMFAELLAKSEHHLTPAHYGFDYYK